MKKKYKKVEQNSLLLIRWNNNVQYNTDNCCLCNLRRMNHLEVKYRCMIWKEIGTTVWVDIINPIAVPSCCSLTSRTANVIVWLAQNLIFMLKGDNNCRKIKKKYRYNPKKQFHSSNYRASMEELQELIKKFKQPDRQTNH